MFDAHCHPQFEAFDGCDVITEAADQGVRGIIAADFDSERRGKLVELGRRGGVWATCGLHPWAIPKEPERREAELQLVEQSLANDGWVGVGEFGLDARRQGAVSMDVQIEVAHRHLELADSLGLPVVMHIVHAEAEMLEVLRAVRFDSGGMCHGFSGTPEQAKRFIDLGLHISIGTSAVRGNVGRVREVCRAIPRSSLLVETDAPSRPPDGVDGPNHPRYLNRVVDAVAEFVSATTDEIAQQTEHNARKLFKLGDQTIQPA